MTSLQESVIRCAIADLLGSVQAYKERNFDSHDWEAHQKTIEELLTCFPELTKDYRDFFQSLM
jgi:hypothetical protein